MTADTAAGAGPGALGAGRFLVVRAGGERFGLDLAAVREVVDLAAPRRVPALVPAVRGVMPLRERFYTLVHLGALLTGATPPAAPSETAVLTDLDGRVVAFEVDDVEAVVEAGATLVGSGGGGGIADIWRVGGELVAALDLTVLAARLTETGAQA